MFISAIRYSYINAKIHSLKNQLLTPLDYKNLLQTRDLNEFVENLRLTAYREWLHDSVSSYDELIRLYYERLFHEYIKLRDALTGNAGRLVNHVYLRYELENIKVALRAICQGESREKAATLLFPLITNSSISMESLLAARDLFDFIQRLKGTWYYVPLDNAYYRFEREGQSFPLEMALDLGYYEILWEIVSSLKFKDKKSAKLLLGLQLDAINILWIIRFKEYYHFSPEEILNYSLLEGCFVTKKVRRKLAYSLDYKDIVGNLNDTPYKVVIDDINDPEIAYARLLKYIYRVVKKNWNGYPFQIGIILDYIFFKDMEVRNLITITEAQRGKLTKKRINNYLVNIT
jgi:V/A-type H+-transporting ATPase subunit C